MISTRKSIWITLALIVPLLFLMGCSDDESAVAPVNELSIVLLAGPGAQGEVPFNAYVTYKWQAKGGSGNYSGYSYTLTRGGTTIAEESGAKFNTITFQNLEPGAHSFSVEVTDTKGATADVSRDMMVAAKEAMPQVQIMDSPLAGGEVAENGAVTFGWVGDDPNSFFGVVTGYTFALMLNDTVEFAGTSTRTTATTITIDSLVVGNYSFHVTAYDNADPAGTATDSVSFTVIPANILWVDDFYQGSLNAEFLELQEKKVTFDGFAWMEFDVNSNYSGYSSTIPLIDAIINAPGSPIEAVIWDNESNLSIFELYAGSNDGTLLADYVAAGGKLVLIGSAIQDQIFDTNPPSLGDFENVFQGMATVPLEVITSDTTEELIYDPVNDVWIPTLVITFDTTSFNPWEHSDYSTLVGANGYSNISIDVGKDDGTHQDSYAYYNLAPSIKRITTDNYDDVPAAYVYDVPGGGMVATIGFPMWFSPTQEYKDVIQKVLKDDFGL
jgi:hypothetical protein